MQLNAQDLGLFQQSEDIGNPGKRGSAVYDNKTGSYEIGGGGENMWFTNDSFHFTWTRVTGDFSLKAAVAFAGKDGNPHRKACLIIRQNLTPGSPYADAAIHGNGLVSLQYRESENGLTREIQAGQEMPERVGIERRGDTIILLLARSGQPLAPAGAFMRIPFTDPVYFGLGVCAHDDKVLEKATLTGVKLDRLNQDASAKPTLHSTLEVIALNSRDRRVVYHTTNHIEAPNWSYGGESLLFNSQGRLFQIPLAGGTPNLIDTGFANKCNNDHGLSPNGKQLAISDQSQNGKSLIYTLPVTGGTPVQVTTNGPSYWHGWSPDGKTLAYCAERKGEFDIYTIPVQGGAETRLTTAKGLDDGPDYSPDGRYIYFNSDRTGLMQIWRMQPDGSAQEQITSDDFNNWFPHPSPDGKWIVFLSYEKDVAGHPANKPVRLRLMPASGGQIQDLARLFGGQGTINVPSWSPDSRQLAFVSYELLPPLP